MAISEPAVNLTAAPSKHSLLQCYSPEVLRAAATVAAVAAAAVYMAPEIFDRDYHWEADMWSLGIMLYQLYARRFPYWRTYEECR